MFNSYYQIELRTGTRRQIALPCEIDEKHVMRFIDKLNQDAATYGCVYVLRTAVDAHALQDNDE